MFACLQLFVAYFKIINHEVMKMAMQTCMFVYKLKFDEGYLADVYACVQITHIL